VHLRFAIPVCLFALPCGAPRLGPHTEITAAGLSVLPEQEKLGKVGVTFVK
jgi:hypothetical protein